MGKQWKKLAIIAGAGALPVVTARACKECNDPVFVIRITADTSPALDEFPGIDCGIGEIGKLLKTLESEQCDAVVFAGVVKRPDFKSLKPDWRGALLLPKVVAAAAQGDGAILSVIVKTMESEGFRVIGAEEAMKGLEAPSGAFGALEPTDDDRRDMRKAAAIIESLGPYDVGQAAIVANGLVLAIEAAEGTDQMLQRCAALPQALRGGARAGVLVKRPKPQQELRIDLPVIGEKTVHYADKAGLRGIAVQAGSALVIDFPTVVQQAESAGLFLYGFSDNEIERNE